MTVAMWIIAICRKMASVTFSGKGGEVGMIDLEKVIKGCELRTGKHDMTEETNGIQDKNRLVRHDMEPGDGMPARV